MPLSELTQLINPIPAVPNTIVKHMYESLNGTWGSRRFKSGKDHGEPNAGTNYHWDANVNISEGKQTEWFSFPH